MEKAKSKSHIIILVLLAVCLSVYGFWFLSSSFKSTILSFISSFYEVEIISELDLKETENLRILKLEEENNLRSELDDIIEQFDNSRDEIDNLNVVTVGVNNIS